MKLRYTLALVLLLSTVCHARIGESLDQLKTRYGDPKFSHSLGSDSISVFNYNGYKVVTIVIENECVGEILSSPAFSGGQAIAMEGIKQQSFFQGLLVSLYGFPEQKIEDAFDRKVGLSHTNIMAQFDFDSGVNPNTQQGFVIFKLNLYSAKVKEEEVSSRISAVQDGAELKEADLKKQGETKGF